MSYSQAGDHTLMCPEDNTLNFQASHYTLIHPYVRLYSYTHVLYVPKTPLCSSGCARKHGGGTRKRFMNKILITMSDHESEFRVDLQILTGDGVTSGLWTTKIQKGR